MEAKYRELCGIIRSMDGKFAMHELCSARYFFDTAKHIIVNQNITFCGFNRINGEDMDDFNDEIAVHNGYSTIEVSTYWIVNGRFIICNGHHGYEYSFKIDEDAPYISYDGGGSAFSREWRSQSNIKVDETIEKIAIHLSLSEMDSKFTKHKQFEFGQRYFVINYNDRKQFEISMD